MPKIAILIYSVDNTIAKLAENEKKGIEIAGGEAEIFQVPDINYQSDLEQEEEGGKARKTNADFPYKIVTRETLVEHDYYLLGIPTKFGNFPAEWKNFWDSNTGGLWAKGSLHGKIAGLFVSGAISGKGDTEMCIMNAMSTLVHHGIIYIPLGYKNAYKELTNIDDVNGSCAWGAGCVSGVDGDRPPSVSELKVHQLQGKTFYERIKDL
ncbi:Rfs1p [Saccharomyces cerevisiae x Saccharomyces kudriavzevii VIN7]|uniref:Rfs1p n=1 Tax=Saccharomyces cerevisiae x Saccharomyces kudriavzevii (strain VIN7) TaxID=1095631 RepID=H0GR75_SACCK|nr:Rfs1p [Saccharomyces cerevisiae x Saccharomyces kudriavzevii VIN7]